MNAERTLVLSKQQTMQKIKRIAFEIYENHFKEQELVLAGVYDKGYLFAQMLKNELEQISALKVTLVKITLDKTAPLQSEITLDLPVEKLKDKCIVITDDVLNTGRTVIYSLKPFLNVRVKSIKTAFIVDRNYKKFPISADFTGFSLATTLKDHIEVELENEASFGVYLV